MALTEEQEKQLLELLAKQQTPPAPPAPPAEDDKKTVSIEEYNELKARSDEQARLLAMYGVKGEKSKEELEKEQEEEKKQNAEKVNGWIKNL